MPSNKTCCIYICSESFSCCLHKTDESGNDEETAIHLIHRTTEEKQQYAVVLQPAITLWSRMKKLRIFQELMGKVHLQGGQHFNFSKFFDFSLTFPENFP